MTRADERARLQERFRSDCPHVDELYVRRVAPDLAPLAQRYNQSRKEAANHADIDRCVSMLAALRVGIGEVAK